MEAALLAHDGDVDATAAALVLGADARAEVRAWVGSPGGVWRGRAWSACCGGRRGRSAAVTPAACRPRSALVASGCIVYGRQVPARAAEVSGVSGGPASSGLSRAGQGRVAMSMDLQAGDSRQERARERDRQFAEELARELNAGQAPAASAACAAAEPGAPGASAGPQARLSSHASLAWGASRTRPGGQAFAAKGMFLNVHCSQERA